MYMKEISIKIANISEANLIYNNIKKCADDMATRGLKNWVPYYSIESIENDIKNKAVYIVRLNEAMVVGNFILTINKENNSLYLGKLAIIPEFSGRGIGSKCLKFIEDYAKKNNIKYIILDVYEKSLDAINFYKKNGYEIIEEKPTRRFIVKVMQKELE